MIFRVLCVFQVLFAIASDAGGASVLLSNSVLSILSHSPLLLLDSPAGYAVSPSKLTDHQKRNLRSILRSLFLFVLTLIQTVRVIRGIREEVVGFVRASINLSLILLEDTDDDLLALDTLGLYESILALLACNREELNKELGGFEEVIARKMMSDLKCISNNKVVLKELGEGKTKRSEVSQRVIESSLLFLNAYGEVIPAEIVQLLESNSSFFCSVS